MPKGASSFIKKYFFIDESGDPAFYAKRKKLLVGTEGFQPLLLIDMITLKDKATIRKKVLEFRKKVKDDPLYNSIPSVADPTGWYLHARGDSPEIRAKFVELLRDLEGFEAHVILGRKRLDLFLKKHNGNEKEFYFDLVYHLLMDRLTNEKEYYQLFLSVRDSNTTTKLRDAINKAVKQDNHRRERPLNIRFNCEIVRSKDAPEMSIVDYMLWALQRYILQGDGRFYKALIDKYNSIIDLYDFEISESGGAKEYNQQNPSTWKRLLNLGEMGI